jgi:hypothetical protein
MELLLVGSDFGFVPETFPEFVPFVLRNPIAFHSWFIGVARPGFISTDIRRHKS